jgi:hypothetical protein
MKRWKNWCLTIIFPHKIHKIWGEICDICNMGCYNVTITSKNSGTFESASLFGQRYIDKAFVFNELIIFS